MKAKEISCLRIKKTEGTKSSWKKNVKQNFIAQPLHCFWMFFLLLFILLYCFCSWGEAASANLLISRTMWTVIKLLWNDYAPSTKTRKCHVCCDSDGNNDAGRRWTVSGSDINILADESCWQSGARVQRVVHRQQLLSALHSLYNQQLSNVAIREVLRPCHYFSILRRFPCSQSTRASYTGRRIASFPSSKRLGMFALDGTNERKLIL